MSSRKYWIPNLKDTTVSLYEGDAYLGFTIHIDHHWDTGAPSEFTLVRDHNKTLVQDVFTSLAEAKQFAEVTYELGTNNDS